MNLKPIPVWQTIENKMLPFRQGVTKFLTALAAVAAGMQERAVILRQLQKDKK